MYFVFEHALDGTLDELLRGCKYKIGEDLVKIYMAQLVNFVEYLQQNNIMHRDLKPGNVMLDQRFNLKVIDFGDAKKVDDKVLQPKEEKKEPDDQVNE